MLDIAIPTACMIESGALTFSKYESLSAWRPKMRASEYSSFSRMKFLVEGMPANPLKSSLKLY
jgi:hypothetical protein